MGVGVSSKLDEDIFKGEQFNKAQQKWKCCCETSQRGVIGTIAIKEGRGKVDVINMSHLLEKNLQQSC